MYKLVVMDKQINIVEALDWYIWAGVDETCADEPCLSKKTELSENILQKNSQATVVAPANSGKNISRTISTQSVSAALKNACDACAKAQTLEELRQILSVFEGCNLKNTATNTVFGDGAPDAKIMLIGEAPGADEDRQGKPFVGKCGKLLDKMLEAGGFERKKCYITNVLPWRPPGNRPPTDDEIAICLPFLKRQIELIKPDFLLLLGGIALKSVTNCPDSISRTRGKWLEYTISDDKNASVLATYHPSYLLRSSAQKAKVWTDLIRLKKRIEETK